MMTNKKNEKQDKPLPLLVTVQFNPKKQPIFDWIISCSHEHYGVHLEDSKNTPTNREMSILFDKSKDGEDFYKIVFNSNLKVTKEAC